MECLFGGFKGGKNVERITSWIGEENEVTNLDKAYDEEEGEQES